MYSCRHLVEEPCSLCAIFYQSFTLNDHTDVDDNEACCKQTVANAANKGPEAGLQGRAFGMLSALVFRVFTNQRSFEETTSVLMKGDATFKDFSIRAGGWLELQHLQSPHLISAPGNKASAYETTVQNKSRRELVGIDVEYKDCLMGNATGYGIEETRVHRSQVTDTVTSAPSSEAAFPESWSRAHLAFSPEFTEHSCRCF
ncbi:hypothetical protein E5288_WYG009321 [Bos mutus]|uniref:Uncharacterized protein n=1 Tax=Bos mutus TaxID=72004 RepID=A0A6B0RZK4_9CETA|nr:hypothetical protein [Bos mutus]